MTKHLKYHKNYTEFGEPYQLVLPLDLEGLVPDDDSVRLLSHELEDLDYSLLYQAYSAKGRNPAVNPKTMFKILTYAYSQTIYSSKKTETACRRDINFMWLLAGRKAPGHSTISRFRCGQRMSVLFFLSFLPPYLLCVKTNKISPEKSSSGAWHLLPAA